MHDRREVTPSGEWRQVLYHNTYEVRITVPQQITRQTHSISRTSLLRHRRPHKTYHYKTLLFHVCDKLSTVKQRVLVERRPPPRNPSEVLKSGSRSQWLLKVNGNCPVPVHADIFRKIEKILKIRSVLRSSHAKLQIDKQTGRQTDRETDRRTAAG